MNFNEARPAWFLHRLYTSSGESWIDFRQVCAVVCHLPNRENFNVDVHMNNGTIFTVSDTDRNNLHIIMSVWQKAATDAKWKMTYAEAKVAAQEETGGPNEV